MTLDPKEPVAAAIPETQLSPASGVSSSVASLALERDVLSPAPPERAAVAQTANGLSDADIMLRVKAGDDAAFDYLVEKYRRPIISFMHRMARNPGVAEELAQEVFLRVYRGREGYEASAKFSTWLYRIATNLAVNYARDSRHERPEQSVSLDEPDPDTGLMVDLPDTSPNVEQDLLRRERLAAIRRHVQELPERQRMAVIMHKYQGLDYRQIADVLKLSESATKSLLFRAYETLRNRLKEFV